MKLKTKATSLAGCLIILLLVFSSAIVGSFFWTYAINSWLLYFGKTVQVSWYVCGLFSLIPHIGWFSIPVSFVTYILLLFI